jgi:putative transposase
LQELFVVKRKRFSVELIVAVLKQAELGMPVADVIREAGISEQTFYRWKKQYASMQSDQVRDSSSVRTLKQFFSVEAIDQLLADLEAFTLQQDVGAP